MQNILLKHYSEYLHALSVAAVQSKKFPFQQIFSLNYAQVSKPGPAAEFCLFFFFFLSVCPGFHRQLVIWKVLLATNMQMKDSDIISNCSQYLLLLTKSK